MCLPKILPSLLNFRQFSRLHENRSEFRNYESKLTNSTKFSVLSIQKNRSIISWLISKHTQKKNASLLNQ